MSSCQVGLARLRGTCVDTACIVWNSGNCRVPCRVRLVEALLGFVAGRIAVVVRFVSIPCLNAGRIFVANMFSETCKDGLSSHSPLPTVIVISSTKNRTITNTKNHPPPPPPPSSSSSSSSSSSENIGQVQVANFNPFRSNPGFTGPRRLYEF